MYALADKYLISNLKILARQKFLDALGNPSLSEDRLETFLSGLKIIYAAHELGDRHSCSELDTVFRTNKEKLKNNKRFAALVKSCDHLAEDVMSALL